MNRSRLYCSTPVGLAGTGSVELFGAACDCETKFLIAAIGVFIVAGYWAFLHWGKRPDQGVAGAHSHAVSA